MKVGLAAGLFMMILGLPLGSARLADYPMSGRQDVPDGLALTGYLASENGNKTIRWTPDGTPEPSGMPAPGPGHRLESTAPAGQENPFIDRFVAEPLPREIRLNASRLIQLDLFVQGEPNSATPVPECVPAALESVCGMDGHATSTAPRCPVALDVAIRTGERRVAGSVNGDHPVGYPGMPQEPAGWTNCRYRLPAEVSILDRTAVLTLEIIRRTAQVTYGLGGEWRSTLTLQPYSDEEWALRDLGGASICSTRSSPSKAEIGTPPGGMTSSGSAAGLPAHGVLALVMMPRLRRARLATILAVVGLLAACLSGPAAPPPIEGCSPNGGVIEITEVPRADAGPLVPQTGSVVGIVTTTAGNALHAMVSFGTPGVARWTDAHGRFIFPGVSTGTHRIQIDAEGYASASSEIRVKVGVVERLTVVLAPPGPVPPFGASSAGPWDRNGTIPVLQQYDLGVECNDAPRVARCAPIQSFRIPSNAEAGPRIVLPGTRVIEVTIDWDTAALPVGRVGLAFSGNHDDNFSMLYPRGPGEPFHVHINQEMADWSAQNVSTFRFTIYVAAEDQPASRALPSDLESARPEDVPSFRVSMTLHRGERVFPSPLTPDRTSVLRHFPPSNAEATGCDANLWKRVYNPGRLEVTTPCVKVTGVVEGVFRMPDGDPHIYVRLDEWFGWMVNDENRKFAAGDLVVEPICTHPVLESELTAPGAAAACRGYSSHVRLPNAGERVTILGSYVLDEDHGWTEIHPVSWLMVG